MEITAIYQLETDDNLGNEKSIEWQVYNRSDEDLLSMLASHMQKLERFEGMETEVQEENADKITNLNEIVFAITEEQRLRAEQKVSRTII